MRGLRGFFCAIALVTWSSTSVSAAAPSILDEAWQFQTLATRGESGKGVSLWAQAAGASVIYYGPSGCCDDAVIYGRFDSVKWNFQELTVTPAGFETGMAGDASGNLYMTFFNNGKLSVAIDDGFTVSISDIDSSAGSGKYSSVSPDMLLTTDTIHVAYSAPVTVGQERVRHARKTGATWEVSTVGAVGSTISEPRIAIVDDSNGVMAWKRDGAYYYSTYESGFWQSEAALSFAINNGVPISQMRTVLGPAEAFVYADLLSNPDRVKLAKFNGTAWTQETVAQATGNLVGVQLSSDINTLQPVVSWLERSTTGSMTLKVVTTVGPREAPEGDQPQIEAWSEPEIMASFEKSNLTGNGLALFYNTVDERRHAAIFESRFGDLSLASWDAGWKTLVGAVPAGYDVLKMEGHRDRILYLMKSSSTDLVVREWNGAAFADSVVPVINSSIYLTPGPDLQIDEAGRPHVAVGAFASPQQGIVYGYRDDSLAWQMSLVRPGTLLGGHIALGLKENATGLPFARIAFDGQTTGTVFMAKQVGPASFTEHKINFGSDVTDIVDAEGNGMGEAQLAITRQTDLAQPLDVRVAVWNDTTGWTTQTIETPVGDDADLAPGALSSFSLMYDGNPATSAPPKIRHFDNGLPTGTILSSTPLGTPSIYAMSLLGGSPLRPLVVYFDSTAAMTRIAEHRPEQTPSWKVTDVNNTTPTDILVRSADRNYVVLKQGGSYTAFQSVSTNATPPSQNGRAAEDDNAITQMFTETFYHQGLCRLITQLFGLDDSLCGDALAHFQALGAKSESAPGAFALADVLGRTSEGNKILECWTEYAAETSLILASHPSLLWDMFRTAEDIMPGALALTQERGDEVKLTQDMADNVQDVAARLRDLASPELAGELQDFLDGYHLDNWVGNDFNYAAKRIGIATQSSVRNFRQYQ